MSLMEESNVENKIVQSELEDNDREGLQVTVKCEESILNLLEEEKHLVETQEASSEPACETSTVAFSEDVTKLDISPLDVMDVALDTHWEVLSSEAKFQLSLIPEGYQPVPHQVGGHRHIDGKQGFLQLCGQPEYLFKPVFNGRKGEQELSFYETVFFSNESSPFARALRLLVPKYFGVEVINDRRGIPSTYMRLEDITSQFSKPCVMDLKLGKRVWDDNASQDKIEREKKKYPIQDTVGIRIIGMRVYQRDTKTWKYVDRHFGRSRSTEQEVFEGISMFFDQGTTARYELIPVIQEKLITIQKWFEEQDEFRLYASSLLFVYEGSEESDQTQVDLRLVDFAHAYEHNQSEIDKNYLFGVNKLVSYFESFFVQ